MKSVVLIGGAGFVGCVLANKLLQLGYKVIIYDLFLFNIHNFSNFRNQANLKLITGDVRDIDNLFQVLQMGDYIIHLACLSNDPSCEINTSLTKDINYTSFINLLPYLSKLKKLKKFIFASSSSVYGVSSGPEVVETSPCNPLTDYSYYKLKCEEALLNTSVNCPVTIVRPATVSGGSPRLRLDVVVNILTSYAYFKKEIVVFGGDQLRPNININDLVLFYIKLIEAPSELVDHQIFNYGEQNYKVFDLALVIKKYMNLAVDIKIKDSDDNRSYQINSDKAYKVLQIYPHSSLDYSIKELLDTFRQQNIINPFKVDSYYNIRVIKQNSKKLL